MHQVSAKRKTIVAVMVKELCFIAVPSLLLKCFKGDKDYPATYVKRIKILVAFHTSHVIIKTRRYKLSVVLNYCKKLPSGERSGIERRGCYG